MEKTTQAMNVPKFMVLFHLSFLLISLVSLSLIIGEVIWFDWSAFWTTVIAVFLNAFFEVLWISELMETKTGKPEAAPPLKHIFPLVSFVVPAHNEEQNIMRCVNSLFKCAVKYRGPSEIIIVDDGSTDNTFQVAWATINFKQRELAHIRAKVVRHMARLGKTEAIRTGVNKAMGEYIALVDGATFSNNTWLNSLVDHMYATKQMALSYQVPPSPNAITAVPSIIRLYRSDALLCLMTEEQTKKIEEGLKISPVMPKKK